MADLSGRVAFVTGCHSGIGKTTAYVLAEHGAQVFVAARSSEKASASAAAVGERGHPVVLDVSERSQWQAAMELVRERYGRLDILVNAAGICEGNSIEDCTEDDLDRHMRANVTGVFLGCQLALPLLCAAGGKGSIINIGSVIVPRPKASLLAYGASKAAMAAMSKSIALHCAEKRLGVRVNLLHPGGIETVMLERFLAQSGQPLEETRAAWQATQAVGRFGRSSEIAQAVLWLASDGASFTTGAELHVNGGGSIA